MLTESFIPSEMSKLERFAASCDTFDKFVRKTDGMDVLYRGHHDGATGNNSFMTDYVGHAA